MSSIILSNYIHENLNKIKWNLLSFNESAINLLEQNQDKINWENLSANSNAINLLEENQDKINWTILSANPGIFEIDYEFLRNRLHLTFGEELMAVMLHPNNINKFNDW